MMVLALENITLAVPNGTTNYSDPHLLCIPSTRSSIAAFFFANYFAHAATVKSIPGESVLSTVVALLMALMFPASGVVRGLTAIHQRAIVSKTPFEAASKAGALCMVVRSASWRPIPGERIGGIRFHDSDDILKSTHFVERMASTRRKNVRLSRTISPDIELARLSDANSEQSQPSSIGQSQKIPSYTSRSQAVIRIGLDNIAEYEIFPPSSAKSPVQGRKVHGICSLPQGYGLVQISGELPIVDVAEHIQEDQSHSQLRLQNGSKSMRKGWTLHCNNFTENGHTTVTEMSCSFNPSKALIAIFQTVYASLTLYQTRGSQLQRYGYASFGLTVAPYLVMSILNFISNILTPDYNTMYLVDSDIMDEATRRGGRFEGTVGSLRFYGDESQSTQVSVIFESNDYAAIRATRYELESFKYRWSTGPKVLEQPEMLILNGPISEACEDLAFSFAMIVGILVAFMIVGIVASLSHFKVGQSTSAQRAWTMTWLVVGMIFGPFGFVWNTATIPAADFSEFLVIAIISGILCIPAVGGFVVVGQMLRDYGNCIRVY